jgi:hypothetical protein
MKKLSKIHSLRRAEMGFQPASRQYKIPFFLPLLLSTSQERNIKPASGQEKPKDKQHGAGKVSPNSQGKAF